MKSVSIQAKRNAATLGNFLPGVLNLALKEAIVKELQERNIKAVY